MRILIAILLLNLGVAFFPAVGKDKLIRVQTDAFTGYIIPKELAPLSVKAPAFWTPSTDEAVAADAAFKAFLARAKDAPAIAFPELAGTSDKSELDRASREIASIQKDYARQARQFVGIIVEGKKQMICHYASSASVPASANFFINMPAGIWQVTYDLESHRCFDFWYSDE